MSLVGYTNAGKSTLFNALTKARVYAADQLFATLDTTSRRIYLGEAGNASAVGELACELAALERGSDAQLDVGVIGCELVDQGVEVVLAGHAETCDFVRAGYRNRTDDLLFTRQLLCQLS